MGRTYRNTPYKKHRNLVAKHSTGKGGPMLSETKKPLRGKAAVENELEEYYNGESDTSN